MITARRNQELDAILARYEEQYEAHTERLGRLLSRRNDRRTAVYDLAQIVSCRQAIADTARALQRMATGEFGRCEHCAEDIPVDRLLQRPQVRWCGRCAAVIPA